MGELTRKQRQRGQLYADQIARLAVDAPDSQTKRDVYSVVNAIRRRYGLSYSEKREEILKAIGLGASKVSDIVNETGITQPDVLELANAMANEKPPLIRKQIMTQTAGHGRPAAQFFPVKTTFYTPKS